ncbi:hypothetical protein Tco_0879728 [Tanacetum coccineum]
MEIGTADAETIADLGICDGVGAHTEDGIGMGVEIAASDIRVDEEEFEVEASVVGTREIVVDPLVTGDIFESTRGGIPDLEDTIYDIVHYMSEVPIDRITEFETAQRQLEAGQLVASGERTSLSDRTRSLERENLKVHRDRDDTQRRLKRLESLVERRLGFRHINDLAALLILKDSKSYMLWAPSWFSKEEDRVSEKFIGDFGGLPVNIRGITWIAAEPTRLQDAVRMANNLMDQS